MGEGLRHRTASWDLLGFPRVGTGWSEEGCSKNERNTHTHRHTHDSILSVGFKAIIAVIAMFCEPLWAFPNPA